MKYEKILDDGRLWSVKYDEDDDNILQKMERVRNHLLCEDIVDADSFNEYQMEL